jgi:hypothetical protein
MQTKPTLKKPLGSLCYRFYPFQNPPNLNAYNPFNSMAWLANTDTTSVPGANPS